MSSALLYCCSLMDEKVKKHNWKNSEHKFTVITFDEMLQEIKKQRILIDD